MRYLFISLLFLVGCSANDPAPAGDVTAGTTAQTGPDAAAGADVVAEAASPAATCVPEGTMNNEKGIGGFCRSSADCSNAAGIRICTADLGISPTFCTTTCQTDTECGSGMYCAHAAMGSGCTPLACVAPGAE
jgi:hypothetical protein